MTPSERASAVASSIASASDRCVRSNSELSAREPETLLVEHEPLQMNLGDAHARGEADEIGQLRDRLLKTGEPERDTRCRNIPRPLVVGKALHVAHDPVKEILTTYERVGGCVGGVERHAKFVEPRFYKFREAALAEQRSVGVEQDMDATILEVADHARQVAHQHRLADTVQDGTHETGELVDDAREKLPRHIGRRLQRLEGARTGLAEQVAAVRDLEIGADRN